MSLPDLESVLRAAPRPMPPPGLQEKLNRQVRLQSVPAPVSDRLSSSGWLRRWWPTLVIGGGLLACATTLVTQQTALRELRAQLAAPPSAGPPSSARITPNAGDVVALKNDRRAEIDRLRAEVAELQATTEEIQQLMAENHRLQKELAEAEAALPGISTRDLEAVQVAQARALSIQCVNNLKQIGLALRIWANHNGAFAPSLLSLTNELGSPKILTCPADPARQAVGDWSTVGPGNPSYEFLASGASEQEPTRVATRCLIHGNIGLCDGSVQMSRDDGANLRNRLVTREGKLYLE